MNYCQIPTKERFAKALRELCVSGLLYRRLSKFYNNEIMEDNKLEIIVTNKDRSYGDSRTCRYYINDQCVLRFDQIPYPECCGIAIIKNFAASRELSKITFIDIIDGFIKDIQTNDNFSKILFYTNMGSSGEKLFSQLSDVTILDPFKNNRSGNILIGFEINLLKKDDLEKNNSVLSQPTLPNDDVDEDSEDGDDGIEYLTREMVRSRRSIRAVDIHGGVI